MKQLICIALIVFTCLCFAACGDSGSNSSDKASDQTPTLPITTDPTTGIVPDETTAPAPVDVPDETQSAVSDKMYNSIDEYLQDPSIAADIAAAEAQYNNGFMSSRIYADGDTLVYQYQYTVELTQDQIDQLKVGLEEGVLSNVEAFKGDLESVRENVNVDNPKLYIVYLAADDSVIYSYVIE